MSDASDAKKIAYKTELMIKLGLAVGLANSFGPRVHMIRPAAKAGHPHRIMCSDGGWIEINPSGHTVRTWGPGRTARDLAAAIKADGDGYAIEHLEPSATVAAPGALRRSSPTLTDSEAKTLADRWRERGFDDVTEDQRGVWVALDGGASLYDIGARVTLYGPVTDEALAAMVAKAKAEWEGRHRLHGTWTDEDRARMWLESQRQGVTMLEYEPSPDLVARWEAERDASGAASGQVLRPDDATAPANAGPMPPISVGGAGGAEPEEPPSPQAGVDEVLARNFARAQADLDALHARWAAEARTEANRDRLRKEEHALKARLAIYARARVLAQAEGLSREDAIRAAYAEAQNHDHAPVASLRR